MLCARIAKLCSSSPSISFRFLSSSKSSPKPRLRKSERLQRDVQLLSKILRSKASWGASTAKRLKQSNVEVTPFHVTEVLRLHRHSIEPAWRFFRWAQQQKRCKRGLFMYSKMLHLLGDAGRFEDIWSLLDDMKRDRRLIPPPIFLGVIRSYVKADQMEGALKALHAMENYGAGEHDRSYAYYKEMISLGLVPNVSTQAAVVASLVKSGILTEALSVFRTAVERSTSTEFDVMKSVVGKAGDCEARLRFFQEARRSGHEASPGAWSVMIYSLSKGGCVGDALDLFRECGDSPDLMALNALVNGLVKEERFEDGVDVVRFMIKRSVGDRMCAYEKLVTLLCKVSRFKDAYEVISQELPEKGFSSAVHLYNKLVYQLGKAGQIEEALKTFERMGGEGCYPDTETYNIVINLLGSVGKVDLAHQLFQQMRENGCEPSLQTYDIMVGLLVRSGRSALSTRVCQEMVAKFPEGALKILRQAQENTRGFEDTRGYSDLVDTCMNMLKGDGSALVVNDAS